VTASYTNTDTASTAPSDEYEGLSSTFAKACRAADARVRAQRGRQRDHSEKPHVAETTFGVAGYLHRLGDLDRWKKWFDARSPEERVAILEQLERKTGRGKW
jgi:hypothetical protein